MPIRWQISHDERLVTVKAEGRVTLGDVESYLDALITGDAMPYAKLFDATGIDPSYDDHDMMMLGARMRAYASRFEGGPLAFVANSDPVRNTIDRYLNLASADRPSATFDTVAEARAWLDKRRTAKG
jgi:hypothetical protein